MPKRFRILKSIDSFKNTMIEMNEEGKEIKKVREIDKEGVISYWIYDTELYEKDSGKLHATGGYLEFEEALKACENLNNYVENKGEK